jgi:hypothetical protein
MYAFDEGEKEKENVCKMSIICSLSSSFSYMSLQMKEIPLVTKENKEKKGRVTIEVSEREIVRLHSLFLKLFFLIDQLNFGKKKKESMTMVKQRRSFFVDDILHMVMPVDKTSNYFNETNDRKRKRSMVSENDRRERGEEDDDDDEENVEEDSTTNKKFRSCNDEDDESKHSQIVDVLGDGGIGEESSMSDDSNSVGNNSGK